MGKQPKATPEKRDMQELDRAIKALQATEHNPVEWAAIIRFVAPIIARIATRYVLTRIARKLNRRISTKIREETVIEAADKLAAIAVKRTLKVVKKK